MILTLIGIGLLVLALICKLLYNHTTNWAKEDITLGIGAVALVIGIGIATLCSIMIIINHSFADRNIYISKLEREAVVKQLELINTEYEDISKTEVIEKVKDWNIDVYREKCRINNPWTSWLFSKKYADSLEYIELED